MNQHELDEWQVLVDAADAFALSEYVGPVDAEAEAQFDAALVRSGRPAGLVGRRVFLGDLSTRHEDAEWRGAR